MTDIKEWFDSEAFKSLPRRKRIFERCKVIGKKKYLSKMFITLKEYWIGIKEFFRDF